MYSREQVVAGLREPRRAARVLGRQLSRRAYVAVVGRLRRRAARAFMTADWDTLVILDACRYDLFSEVNTLPGTLERAVSPGTGTDEFLVETVEGRSFPDTVYLTANPHLHFRDAAFHDVVRLWETDWDDELDTVPPDVAVERAIEAHEAYPDKRVVVHLVQPHYPFIGERGRALARRGFEIRGFLEDTPSIFHHLERGTVDRETVWAAYRENLELTLPHVRALLAAVSGKVVVTADHGNAFGEWGVYGHGGPHIPALVDVPWLTAPFDERRDVVAGEATVNVTDLAAVERDGVVEDRLRKLGYL